jgi:hypothetical protein
MKIKISKNRDGTIGGIDFAFFPEYCRINEFEYLGSYGTLERANRRIDMEEEFEEESI